MSRLQDLDIAISHATSMVRDAEAVNDGGTVRLYLTIVMACTRERERELMRAERAA